MSSKRAKVNPTTPSPEPTTLEPIGLNDFTRQWAQVGEAAQAAFRQVGQSGRYVLGKEVELFEQELAKFASLPHAIGCASGLDAIEIGLRALNLQPGQKVLTTPLSAFATTLAILRAGGTPTFIDVDEHGLLDLNLAEQALESDPCLKFLVPVHLYGRSLDLPRLQHLKDKYQLDIVEDAAQAIGATHQGKPVGSVGQVTAISFYPTKNLGCMGDGGAVLTSDPALEKRCRTLRDYGQTSKYVHAELGLNSRLDEVQAAILRQALLPELSTWTDRRKAIAERYLRTINHPEVQLPTADDEAVWHLFPVRSNRRDSLMAHLRSHQIQSAVHYPGLIPEQEAMRDVPPSPPTPTALITARTVLSLPIHPFLTDSEIERVASAVNAWPTPV